MLGLPASAVQGQGRAATRCAHAYGGRRGKLSGSGTVYLCGVCSAVMIRSPDLLQSGLASAPLNCRPGDRRFPTPTQALRHSDPAVAIQVHAVAPEWRNLIGRIFTRPLCPVLGSKPAPPPPQSARD